MEGVRTSCSVMGDSQAVRLGRLWSTSGRFQNVDVECSCAGSGWTTTQLKMEIRKVTITNSIFCVVLVGINDILRNIPLTVIKRNIKTIVKLLTKQERTVFVILVTLPPTLNASAELLKSIKQFNVFIQSLATFKQTSIIQFHKLFVPFSHPDNRLYQCVFPDGRLDKVHLSRRGYGELLALLRNRFAELRCHGTSSLQCYTVGH